MSQAPSTASTNHSKNRFASRCHLAVWTGGLPAECEAGDSLGLRSEIMTKLYSL